MPCSKTQIIYYWKKRGLIYDDYDDLYEVYIKTMQCQHCNREFKNSTDRCMDHDHTTGKFRKIVCRSCNSCDSYINHPNGNDKKAWQREYNSKHKEESYKWRKEKTTCICGEIITRGWKYEHLKTQRHLKRMDIYMNNVD